MVAAADLALLCLLCFSVFLRTSVQLQKTPDDLQELQNWQKPARPADTAPSSLSPGRPLLLEAADGGVAAGTSAGVDNSSSVDAGVSIVSCSIDMQMRTGRVLLQRADDRSDPAHSDLLLSLLSLHVCPV